jgi:hypothetical protein
VISHRFWSGTHQLFALGRRREASKPLDNISTCARANEAKGSGHVLCGFSVNTLEVLEKAAIGSGETQEESGV